MSLIIDERDKFVKYKYAIAEFYIIINGVSYDFPIEKVTGFKIENYYEDAIFPIFKMNTVMEASRYYEIIENKDNVKFKVRIQGYYTKNDSEIKSMSRDVVNEMFVIFTDESNGDFEKDRKKISGTQKDKGELEKNENEIELFLFPEKIVTGLRSLYNGVIHNSNLATIVMYLLQLAGAKNVLMSPFDNTTVFDNIVLPPQNIERQLRYLSNVYGFHESGTMMFFGLNKSYILNCNGQCTAYDDNDTKETIIYILDANNPNSVASGSLIKYNDERNYINVSYQDISIDTTSISSNVITGVDADIVNVQTGELTEVQIDTDTVGGKNNKGVIYNLNSNPYYDKIYASLKTANSKILTIGIQDDNVLALTPNKNVSVVFESPSFNDEYKGNYRIASTVHIFTGATDNFNIGTVVTLKKVD